MRKRKLTKVVVAALSFSLCLGIFAGCEKKDNGNDSVMQETDELKNKTSETTLETDLPQDDEMVETKNTDTTETVSSDATESEVAPVEETVPLKNEDGSYALACDKKDCEYSGRVDYTPMEGYTLDEDLKFREYINEDEHSFRLDFREEGEDYFIPEPPEEANISRGVISTPIGDMTYFSWINNHFFDLSEIYGDVKIDSGHYLVMHYCISGEGYDEVTHDWLIEKLTNLAQGLKAAQ